MIFPIEIDPLAGVFGFLNATLPARLRKAAEETDLGIGRLAEANAMKFPLNQCARFMQAAFQA